jgi:TonB family protein
MKEIVIYLLKASLSMAILYGFYSIVLHRDTWFGINRIYLLFSALISLLIPMAGFRFSVSPQLFDRILLSQMMITSSGGSEAPGALPDFWTLCVYAWLAGSLFFLARLGIRIAQILRIIYRSERQYGKGYTIVFTKEEISAFSFFRYIFLPESMMGRELNTPVFLHEQVHARQFHTLDLILCELLTAFFWFNPVVYLLNHSLKSQHEFLADEAVLRSGIRTAHYQELILQAVPGIRLNAIAPNFNISLIKNRMIMMTKIRSASAARTKVLLSLPLCLLVAFLLSGGTMAQSSSQDKKPETKSTSQDTQSPKKNAKTGNYTVVDKQPEYPGGQQAMMEFLGKNISYPEDAKKNNIEGTVVVSFVVSASGKIKDVALTKSIGHGCDQEAERVVKMMPDWTPGEQRDQKVDVEMCLPIKFKLDGDKGKAPAKDAKGKK